MKRAYSSHKAKIVPLVDLTPAQKRTKGVKLSVAQSNAMFNAGVSAFQAARAARNMRSGGYIGQEVKFIDYEYSGATAITVAGSEADPATALSLNAIATGDGPSNRIGREVDVRSIHVRGYVQFSAFKQAAITNYDSYFVRLLVVQDTQTNAQQLNAEDVVVDPTNAALEAVTPRNLAFVKRFTVLADKIVRMPPTAMAWDGSDLNFQGARVPFEIFRKCPMRVTFQGTTAAIGSIADNSIHVICIAANNAIEATLFYYSRCRFVG